MNLLSIDLGDKRCGIAYTIDGFVFPGKTFPRVEIIPQIKKIIIQKNISKIIVWMPYDLYGIENKQAEKTQKFLQKLKNIFPHQEILSQDERFSTFWAKDILRNMKIKDIDAHKDAYSAALILESYLEQN